MKLEVSTDELWPIYILEKPREDVITEYILDIPDELYEEYLKVVALFKEMQDKIKPYFEQARAEENKKYHELMEMPRRSKIEIVEYKQENCQECGNCNQPQLKGVYQGGKYIGCETCSKIEAPSRVIWPNLLEDSVRVSRFP